MFKDFKNNLEQNLKKKKKIIECAEKAETK